MKYYIAKCPNCNHMQIVELADYDDIWMAVARCESCRKIYKILNKRKPSWQGNLALVEEFKSREDAEKALKWLQGYFASLER